MSIYEVKTAGARYDAIVERGVLARVRDFLPPKHGKIFVVTEERVWKLHGAKLGDLTPYVLHLPGGEDHKRLAPLETLAEHMMDQGADRTSIVVAFGGGIVTDMGGFLAAIFMRGIPVIQIPTTLLAQVDAAVGGKTGVNLTRGKNLIGSFHQPLAVLSDPAVLDTLSDREYRAGLFEVIKCGVIASPPLFALMRDRRDAVLAREPAVVDELISECVRIKCEVVTADEKEMGIRKILNFGHTIGHALEAETRYQRLLHGEAVAFGMKAATFLARDTKRLSHESSQSITGTIEAYGPIPTLDGITPESLIARLGSDKKTVQGHVHFVLPIRIGGTVVVDDVPLNNIAAAIQQALA